MTDNPSDEHVDGRSTLRQASMLWCGHDIGELVEQVACGHGDELTDAA